MDRLALLEDLEKLKHNDRVKEMVQLGRKSREDISSLDLISQLVIGPVYEQTLALQTCYGSQQVSIAKELLLAPSMVVKYRAVSLISTFGTDTEVLNSLKIVPEYLQISAVRQLRLSRSRRRRPAVIDAFLQYVLDHVGYSRAFRRMLPFGTSEMVERHLPTLTEGFTKSDWSCLARYHPRTALNVLKDWISKLGDEDDRLSRASGAALDQFLARQANIEMGLELLLILSKAKKFVPSNFYEMVAEKRPEQVLDLMFAFGNHISHYMFRDKQLAKLPISKLLSLFERYPGHLTSNDFKNLTPSQRVAIYDVVRVGWRLADTSLPQVVVKSLPTELRILEARRNADLQAFESAPSRRIPYIALLPWEEAITLQKPFLQSGDAAIRQQALHAQIGAAVYYDNHLGDALQLVLSRKNDQDPVRGQMLAALRQIPVTRWNDQHLENLTQIIQNSLDSTDVSTASIFSIWGILANIMSVHPRWAATQMRGLFLDRSRYECPFTVNFSGVLPIKNVMAIVVEELSAVVQNASQAKDVRKLLILTEMFGRHTNHWPELLDALELILTVPEGFQDETVLAELEKYRPETWHNLMADLNGSYVTWAELKLKYVHAYRQDMLSYYFEEMLYPDIEKPAFKQITGCFWRWTHTQQEGLAQLILEGLSNPEEDDYEKAGYIKQLGALSFVGEKHLILLANDKAPLVRDLALRSLGRFDGSGVIPELVAALFDDRARIAIYSLRNALKTMPKREALNILRETPLKRVTVAKEVIRMIGDLETAASFQGLMELDKQDLNIDVRISLFRALWCYLELPQTWEIFSIAAQDPNPATAKAICIIPDDGMTTKSRNHFHKLMVQLFDHPVAEVRIAALRRCYNVPLKDPENNLGPRLFELVASPLRQESTSAIVAIFRTYAKSQPHEIANIFRKSLTNQLKLRQIHDLYISETSWFWSHSHRSAHLVLPVLKEDRLSVSLRLALMFRINHWSAMRSYFYEIIPELHADALTDAHSLIQENQQRRTIDDNFEAESKLLDSKDEKARRLALSFLLAGISPAKGWSDEQRKRLDMYREDASVLVAERAWKVVILDKDEKEEKLARQKVQRFQKKSSDQW